jgi:metallo-beta-lactamase family protein
MKLTIWGAAQNVTGSKHLMQTGDYNLLLDCGSYQGKRNFSDQMNRQLPFPADKIDAVILSHAHLDHCGMLPILVKDGFKGRIYCTGATADIAKFILLDSAGIQKSDCDYYNSHIDSGEEPILPTYTDEDVQRAIARFEIVDYFSFGGEWKQLNKTIRFKFYDAGHILGSAATLIEVIENGTAKILAFTGDIGRNDLPILRSPEMIEEKVSTLLMECTYGNRIHRPVAQVAGQLKEIINESVYKKSKIIVPAFSLGRIQELIYILHRLTDQNAIPHLPIYIDSPLSNSITEVFPRYIEYFDNDFWKDFGNEGKSAFLFKNLKYVRSVEESKAINNLKGPFIVIAASGMAEGGRILHHLKNNINDPNNFILITGYQAENTLGRKILEGVTPVKIYGKFYDVRAKVAILNELSAHADQNNLLAYVDHSLNDLKKLILVHTEMPQALPFKTLANKTFPALSVNIPALGDRFEI